MVNLPLIAVIILVSMAFFTMLSKKNLIKMVMAVHVMGSAVNIFLISLGYKDGGVAPIFTNAPGLAMVLPTPQALTLTSIVIDIAVVSLMLSFAVSIYAHYGTLDTRKTRLKG